MKTGADALKKSSDALMNNALWEKKKSKRQKNIRCVGYFFRR